MNTTTYYITCGDCLKKNPHTMTPELELQYRQNGADSNYPLCCIEAFIADCKAGMCPAVERECSINGYIPCNAHKQCILDLIEHGVVDHHE